MLISILTNADTDICRHCLLLVAVYPRNSLWRDTWATTVRSWFRGLIKRIDCDQWNKRRLVAHELRALRRCCRVDSCQLVW